MNELVQSATSAAFVIVWWSQCARARSLVVFHEKCTDSLRAFTSKIPYQLGD